MSLKAIEWVLAQKNVPLPTRAVLLVIAYKINRNGDAWPSLKTIAAECEIKERMVMYHLSKATEMGLINIRKERKKGSVYSFPAGAINCTVQNIAGLQDIAGEGAKYCRSHPYINRKEKVKSNSNREAEEKNQIPEWAEIVNQTAEFCGGQPLTDQHISAIEKKGESLDLKDQALAFEDHHITTHKDKPYKKFATYLRFSSTWLTNSLEDAKHGTPNRRISQSNSPNGRGATIGGTHAPIPGEPVRTLERRT